jgi:hypothetical protein
MHVAGWLHVLMAWRIANVQVWKRCAALIAFSFLQGSAGLTQSAMPTGNILTRVLMVESRHGRGTIFSLDVDQREYWITAKHILTGAEHPPYGAVTDRSVTLRILNPEPQGEQWLPVNFSVIDPGNDIDIVVLVASQPILHDPLPSALTGSKGLYFGGDCEFLGFPFGGGWRATYADGQSIWMPYVKHCTVSGQKAGEPIFWVLDGINNFGFSGGPVIFRTGTEQAIFAVVSGFVSEPAEVISSSTPKSAPTKKGTHKEKVNVNSGFIIAFDISYAMKAIHNSPIGPLRK